MSKDRASATTYRNDSRLLEKGEGKRLYIENLGCAKNQVDAEVMAHNLAHDGWVLVDDASQADLVIVNTCAEILVRFRRHSVWNGVLFSFSTAHCWA